MATPVLSVPPTTLVAGVPIATRAWPAADSITLQLDDSLFLTGRVRTDIEFSWDGGKSYGRLDPTEWAAGAKDRHGNPPQVTLGPFRFGPDFYKKGDPLLDGYPGGPPDLTDPKGTIVNPTHYKVTLVPVLGSPSVGINILVG